MQACRYTAFSEIEELASKNQKRFYIEALMANWTGRWRFSYLFHTIYGRTSIEKRCGDE